MDSSKRAVESYRRSRMIDAATSDEDSITPVYKLDEIGELLRSSDVSIAKDVSEFILKRLDHTSPIVKQKALRLIKYVVGKCGVEFRREMQRNSVAIRQLFHYKGESDPLNGDALNKAVRDTAHEAISAVFADDDDIGKPSPADDLNQRIQGFGNTNFETPSDDKKSFLSEVVGIGCATIKQGISTLARSRSLRKNDTGNYKGPTLRRSLTTEIDNSDRYEPVVSRSDAQGVSKNTASGPWGQQEVRELKTETREERLLETIATSGGVRLQPTRDAVRAFLVEAVKLDALALSQALESKLQSPIWQVRMKAMCVLESILRRKEDEHFLVVASYFTENVDAVSTSSDSPQASLREKTNKVLILLNGEQRVGLASHSEKSLNAETTLVQMPDLIHTGDQDDYNGLDNPTTKPLIDDLFGDGPDARLSTDERKNDDDPFADVSFHTGEGTENVDDLFSGITINDKSVDNGTYMAANEKSEVIDIFGTNSEDPPEIKTNAAAGAGINENMMFPLGTMPYVVPPGIMMNTAFSSQPMNYGAMGSFFAQQQLLATMSNLQHFGNYNAKNAGINNVSGGSIGGPPLPDIFQSTFTAQMPSSIMNCSKKEDSRAFDFISDRLAAARDPKRAV
ncbi:hypothetical protein V6N13_093918 [Hibiscus sabdariffa]|uniref:VHS domain-containing protein n=1 Tax=Hibiscus sabdariffa TaxID=183260 RepID=A0ABR2NL30_9ROSI